MIRPPHSWFHRIFPSFLLVISACLNAALAQAAVGETITLDAGTREKCLLVLRSGIRSAEFWPSIHAAEGLTLGGHGEETIAFLEPLLTGPYDDQQRCGLARELVRAGQRDAAGILLKILAGKESFGHVHAAESLYKVGELGDGVALRNAFEQTENPRLRLMAAAALGKAGNLEGLAHARKMMFDPDPELARTAAWIVARIGRSEDVKALKAGLKKMTDEFSRSYFENALATLGDAEGKAALARNLNSNDPAVRTYAATFAGDSRAVAVADRLKELLDDENIDVRVRAAQSLLVLSRPAPDTKTLAVCRLRKIRSINRWFEQTSVAVLKRKKQFEELDTLEKCQAWQKSRREFFLKQLGGLPEKTPLEAEVVGKLDGGDYRVEKVIYQSRPQHHVTATVYLPKTKGPYPAVLIACGHTKSGKAADYNQKLGILLAKNGMAAMCYDPIGQGERSQNLTPAGKPVHSSSVTEHFLTGVGAILTGTNTAQYRIWDGIRGIDYLCGRKDILPEKIGCTGCSGGGTLTSYLMALDDRVYCAAPACYLTTFGKLIETIGPQDAEQNIHAQIAFGMDQTDYVLIRAPKPTLICCTTSDFFNIEGTWDTFRQSKRFYAQFNQPEQINLVESAGKHGITQTGREAIVRWMQRWLLGVDKDVKDPGSKTWSEADLQCTPQGQVLLLKDEKSVFDLNAQRAEAYETARKKFAELPAQEAREVVRSVASIRHLEHLPAANLRTIGMASGQDYQIRKLAMEVEDGVSVPILRVLPNQPNGERTLYLSGNGKQDCLENPQVQEKLRAGQEIWVMDLRGLGELRQSAANEQLGDWKTFFLAYLLDQSLVGGRTEDVFHLARLMKTDAGENAKPIELLADGEAGITVFHAKALEPELFGAFAVQQGLDSWAEVCKESDRGKQLPSAIHGVLMHYDLPDLVRLMK